MVPGGDAPKGLFQTDFAPGEFAARRRRVLEAIGPEALALLQGAGPVRGFEVFQQTNELYYLCGVEVPQAYLMLDGRDGTTTLYLPHADAAHARSEGSVLTADDADLAIKLTGVDSVRGPQELSPALAEASVLYVPHAPAEGRQGSRDVLLAAKRKVAGDPWDGRASREAHLLQLLADRCPRAEVRDLSPVLDELRLLKSAREVEWLRRAARLSGLAVMEAMRSTRPGVFEYQLGAVAQYVFLGHGARGEGYRAIIAGGGNTWFPHYFRNDAALQDGDLVLMDCAPDYGYYTSDIGRMWPVNGTYSPLQRELYGFVVAYHQALLARIRPAVTAAQVMQETAAAMQPVIEGWAFSQPIYGQAARRMLEFTGHLSHPVGMAVHDVGNYHARELAPGMVFTVDPQMWVPEEQRYIRCEDTVVVAEEGIENLTGFVPLELNAVEALMREEGLLQKVPPRGFA